MFTSVLCSLKLDFTDTTEEKGMGKSNLKFHRFLSVPVNLEVRHFAISSNFTKDGDKITCVDNSLGNPIRLNLSSGTVLRTPLPGGKHNKDWTGDTDKTYKKEQSYLSDISTMKHEKRNMPVLEARRNRRCALGDIYENIKKEDLEHIFAIFDTSAELERDPSETVFRKRRPALADIFHDVTQEDVAHIMGIFGDKLSEDDTDLSDTSDETSSEFVVRRARRSALANVFEGISQNEKERVISGLEFDDSDSEEVFLNDSSEDGYTTQINCRRNALWNIFEGIRAEDVEKLSDIYDVGQSVDTVTENEFNEQNGSLNRRCAVGDIFESFSESDVQRFEHLLDKLNFEELSTPRQEENEVADGCSKIRRFGLGDIFRGIEPEDIQTLLFPYQ